MRELSRTQALKDIIPSPEEVVTFPLTTRIQKKKAKRDGCVFNGDTDIYVPVLKTATLGSQDRPKENSASQKSLIQE